MILARTFRAPTDQTAWLSIACSATAVAVELLAKGHWAHAVWAPLVIAFLTDKERVLNGGTLIAPVPVISAEAAAMTIAAMAQVQVQMLNTGLKETGMSMELYQMLTKMDEQQNQDLMKSISTFAAALGGGFGGSKAT